MGDKFQLKETLELINYNVRADTNHSDYLITLCYKFNVLFELDKKYFKTGQKA